MVYRCNGSSVILIPLPLYRFTALPSYRYINLMRPKYLSKEKIANWFMGLQDRICESLEGMDGGGKFQEDQWERPGGGGGRSRVIKGKVIEKGGVNFSAVHGEMPAKISEKLGLPPSQFFATGVSIVLHPINPLVPIIHMNVRYFQTVERSQEPGDRSQENQNSQVWWFGGGIDLTPHYVVEDDARFFHKQMKKVCDKHNPEFYPEFKKWADEYFYLKHRKETRGIGGIFFDHLNEKRGLDKDQAFAFVKDVGETFAPTYIYLALRNRCLAYTEREKEWQAIRRSRYVEFNLLWDRGTKFGLDTDGRTESILMSMPPQAKWFYQYKTEEGSKEEATLNLLKKGVNWIND